MVSVLLRPSGLVLLAALLSAACGAGAAPEPTLNVLLVSLDTVRADHLGAWGHEHDTSPRLDAFAANAVRYASAWAPAPWTLPSHAAMLSGRHPYLLGIHDKDGSLPADVPLLAERLGAAGYATAAFVDSAPGGYVGRKRGFDRGFSRYEHAPHADGLDDEYDVAATVDAGLTWLDARDASQPFLLFLHTKSAHATPAGARRTEETDSPYAKPDEYQTRFLADGRQRFKWHNDNGSGVHYLRWLNERIGAGLLDPQTVAPAKRAELADLYDGGIAYTDDHLGRLFDGLAERGLLASTLVIVTSDHGEGFAEQRFFLHKELHPGLLHVPLVIRDPQGPRGLVVDERVGLEDVVPTVLERVGLPVPDELTGVALPRDGSGPGARRMYSYFAFEDGYYYEAWAVHEGASTLRTERFGDEPGYRTVLFDTHADPLEQRPVEDQRAREAELLRHLLRWKEQGAGASTPAVEYDSADLDRLRSLGYLK